MSWTRYKMFSDTWMVTFSSQDAQCILYLKLSARIWLGLLTWLRKKLFIRIKYSFGLKVCTIIGKKSGGSYLFLYNYDFTNYLHITSILWKIGLSKKMPIKIRMFPQNSFQPIFGTYFRYIEIYFSSMNYWRSNNHFLAGDRWFNVGIQIAKSISKETNILTSEMTFNCHRGYALIYDSTSMPTSELNLEKPIGK